MKYKILLLLSIAFAANACEAQKPLQFNHVYSNHPGDLTDSGKIIFTALEDYYFVKNYTDNETCDALIDSFAFNTVKPEFLQHNLYAIEFFIWPQKINSKRFSKNCKVSDNYFSQDNSIFFYLWENGKFSDKEKTLTNG